MRPIRHLSAARQFGRRRQCSSLPVKIPTAETRSCRRQIGLAPAPKMERGPPSRWRDGHLALHARMSRAVLSVVENASFSLPPK
jgi:hypothetical protein